MANLSNRLSLSRLDLQYLLFCVGDRLDDVATKISHRLEMQPQVEYLKPHHNPSTEISAAKLKCNNVTYSL